MKKSNLLISTIALVIFILSSCSKDSSTTPTPNSTARLGVPVAVAKYEAYIYKWISNSGDCGLTFASIDEYENYELHINQFKGMAYAKDLGSGIVEFTYYLPENRIDGNYFDEMVIGKKFRIDTACTVPQNILNESFKNAGISKIPTEDDMFIAKGIYPIDVDSSVSRVQHNNFKLIIKRRLDWNTKKTSFSAAIKPIK